MMVRMPTREELLAEYASREPTMYLQFDVILTPPPDGDGEPSADDAMNAGVAIGDATVELASGPDVRVLIRPEQTRDELVAGLRALLADLEASDGVWNQAMQRLGGIAPREVFFTFDAGGVAELLDHARRKELTEQGLILRTDDNVRLESAGHHAAGRLTVYPSEARPEEELVLHWAELKRTLPDVGWFIPATVVAEWLADPDGVAAYRSDDLVLRVATGVVEPVL